MPAGFKTEVVGDQSIFIKASIESIRTHLIEGSILAAIVVFIFLWSFRSTVIAALAIPTSLIATFGLMAAMGFTLNQITMLALTLMVGIVIDDAIVVLENIFRFIEEKGMPPFQAAIEGTRGDWSCRHGDNAFAARRVLAGWLYGWHRRPFHVVVWIYRFIRYRRFPAGFIYADPDAVGAANQAQQGSGRHSRRRNRPIAIRRSGGSIVRLIADTHAC